MNWLRVHQTSGGTKRAGWRLALLALIAVFVVAAGAMTPARVSAYIQPQVQSGTNWCLTQGHNVYASATYNSRVVGWVSYYDVWHHYNYSGNWSLGYVRGNPSIAGYIPAGLLQYQTSDYATHCH